MGGGVVEGSCGGLVSMGLCMGDGGKWKKGKGREGRKRRTIFVAGVEDYAGDDAVVDSLLDGGFEVVGGCHGE